MKVCKHDRVLRCVDCEVEALRSKVDEMQNAFETIHGIASETFESPNQLELIRLTAAENLKGATNEST